MRTILGTTRVVIGVVCTFVASIAAAQITPFTSVDVGFDSVVARADTTNKKVFVSNYGSDTVSVVNPDTYAVTATIATGDGPRRMGLNSTTNKLYVVNTNGSPNVSSVTVINAATNAFITTISLGSKNARNLAINETLNKIYVWLQATGEVAIIDGATDTLATTVAVGAGANAGCINTVTGKVYVMNNGGGAGTTVSVIDGTTNAVSGPITVGTGPSGCGVDTATNRIFVTNSAANTVSVIDGSTDTVTGSPLAVGAGPSFGTLSTTHNILVILNFGSDTISLFELDSLTPLGTLTTGTSPWLAYIDPTPFALYVTNFGAGTVSVIDLHTLAVAATITTGGNPTWIARYFQNIYVVRNNGINNGTNPVSAVAVLKRMNFRKAADISGDAKSDLLWYNTSSKKTAAWLMDGTTPTSSSDLLGTSEWKPVLQDDLDGDGTGDIVWRNSSTTHTALWLMDGLAKKPGPTGSGTILGASTFEPFAIGSFDGNGANDILWRDPASGALAIWTMEGMTPTRQQQIFSGPAAWEPILGNFNGDFHTDLLWYNSSTGVSAIWLMAGDAASGLSYTGSSIMPGGTPWRPIFTGDFDGDGRADIVWENQTTGNTAIWLMNGLVPKANGTGEILSGASGWRVTQVRDLDGDLKSDLVFRNITTGHTAAWLMNGLSIKANGSATLLTDSNWEVTHTFDTNNDLKGDLLWRNNSTGGTALWLMNGLSQLPGSRTILVDSNWKVVPD